MNKNQIIKISNIVGFISIVLLIYWVFIFISNLVFDFRVFKERITDSFYFSIIGILSLMAGALMINIMLNLTKISEYVDLKKDKPKQKLGKISVILIVISFPIIFGLMVLGDKISSNQQKSYLIKSAQSIIDQHPEKIKQITNYSFTKEYLTQTERNLDLISKLDKNFPFVFIITQDTIDNTKAFLSIRNYEIDFSTKEPKGKINYIYSCSKEEREYLLNVYNDGEMNPLFTSKSGKNELFFPVNIDGNTVVIYFSEFQRYGTRGSS